MNYIFLISYGFFVLILQFSSFLTVSCLTTYNYLKSVRYILELLGQLSSSLITVSPSWSLSQASPVPSPENNIYAYYNNCFNWNHTVLTLNLYHGSRSQYNLRKQFESVAVHGKQYSLFCTAWLLSLLKINIFTANQALLYYPLLNSLQRFRVFYFIFLISFFKCLFVSGRYIINRYSWQYFTYNPQKL